MNEKVAQCDHIVKGLRVVTEVTKGKRKWINLQPEKNNDKLLIKILDNLLLMKIFSFG